LEDRIVIEDTANIETGRLDLALAKATAALLEGRNAEGSWTGELSSSALSTATAITALAVFNRSSKYAHKFDGELINSGLEWLAQNVNADGGWGDTTRSISNLSTTLLCWAAFGAVEAGDERFASVVQAAEDWISNQAGSTSAERIVPAIIRRYGKDRTFSVPILTMCALAGRLGPGAEAWKSVMPLPFELAALPRTWFGALRLPVVSYALPALIAIGQARHFHRPTRNPITRFLRAITRSRTLRVLEEIQPSNGGFLEATPLTSFVAMSLAGSGNADHAVTRRAIEFLRRSVRKDGSWPIDTNLGTWVTTLSLNALTEPARDTPTAQNALTSEDRYRFQRWLQAQQQTEPHPYTNAAPGGWAWTHLPGGVPDADDTCGALLALRNLDWSPEQRMTEGVAEGLKWLINLQNEDGGVPTFCRGWGTLPFDRSSPDLTAHAIRAWLAWRPYCEESLSSAIDIAAKKAVGYILKSVQPDGSWAPLWFGNQFAPDDVNATYGTARVLQALIEVARHESAGARLSRSHGAVAGAITRAIQWLMDAQSVEGSWGGCPGAPGSVEETALAVLALAEAAGSANIAGADVAPGEELHAVVHRGAMWLIERIEDGSWVEPTPIGFYFAKLWYYEKTYPLAFTIAALRAVSNVSAMRTQS
jgi:squalene-hopene/tetraprenyl-beta-curcumene cyclase